MINWQSLGDSLAARLHLPVTEVTLQELGGGDISQAFRLRLGEDSFFVKTNQAQKLAMFEAERAGLDAIRQSRTIRVPQVFITGEDAGQAFIVMEYIEFGRPPAAQALAVALARLHGNFHERFGFHGDNNIGSTSQLNAFSDDWVEFWRQQRLGFQLELAAHNGFDAELVDAGNRLRENIERYFDNYHPRPSLLHGDLWNGNVAADIDGNPVIYDPACYFGDHEADLAMMELFGNPGEAFFAEYDRHFPIDAGYPVRRELYNLYHVLNHANLFGGGYAAQAMRMISGLLAR
jgi:protein-ribulosamine 3-kinase